MKDLTTTATAELLAEIKYLSNKKSHPQVNWATNEEKVSLIAAELDRRCSERGIALIGGFFVYKRTYFSVILEDGEYLLRESCDPTYSQDLRSWLLLKGGNG